MIKIESRRNIKKGDRFFGAGFSSNPDIYARIKAQELANEFNKEAGKERPFAFIDVGSKYQAGTYETFVLSKEKLGILKLNISKIEESLKAGREGDLAERNKEIEQAKDKHSEARKLREEVFHSKKLMEAIIRNRNASDGMRKIADNMFKELSPETLKQYKNTKFQQLAETQKNKDISQTNKAMLLKNISENYVITEESGRLYLDPKEDKKDVDMNKIFDELKKNGLDVKECSYLINKDKKELILDLADPKNMDFRNELNKFNSKNKFSLLQQNLEKNDNHPKPPPPLPHNPRPPNNNGRND